jgi:hypothetical protein
LIFTSVGGGNDGGRKLCRWRLRHRYVFNAGVILATRAVLCLARPAVLRSQSQGARLRLFSEKQQHAIDSFGEHVAFKLFKLGLSRLCAVQLVTSGVSVRDA